MVAIIVGHNDTSQKPLLMDAYLIIELNHVEQRIHNNPNAIFLFTILRILIRSSRLTHPPAIKIMPINIHCVIVNISPKKVPRREQQGAFVSLIMDSVCLNQQHKMRVQILFLTQYWQRSTTIYCSSLVANPRPQLWRKEQCRVR